MKVTVLHIPELLSHQARHAARLLKFDPSPAVIADVKPIPGRVTYVLKFVPMPIAIGAVDRKLEFVMKFPILPAGLAYNKQIFP